MWVSDTYPLKTHCTLQYKATLSMLSKLSSDFVSFVCTIGTGRGMIPSLVTCTLYFYSQCEKSVLNMSLGVWVLGLGVRVLCLGTKEITLGILTLQPAQPQGL